MHGQNRMVIDFKPAGEPGTRVEFSYHITPATITITGKGRISVGKDLEAVLRKIEYWHQAPITKFRIMARQGQGDWRGVRWDGKGNWTPMPPSMWSGFATSRAAAAINGGGSD